MTEIGTYLTEHASTLATELVEGVLVSLEISISDFEKEQAIIMFSDMFTFLATEERLNYHAVPTLIMNWSMRNAAGQVSTNSSISEIIIRYTPTRMILTDILIRLRDQFQLPQTDFDLLLKKMNQLLDISLNETIASYEILSEEHNEAQQKEMAALSAPLVLIKEGVVVLPLIGSIDSFRITHLTDNVIPEISKKSVNVVIADFSGMHTFDERMAHHLFQLSLTLRLMGITTFATGISPFLAHSIVTSNIDFSHITFYANVKQALEKM